MLLQRLVCSKVKANTDGPTVPLLPLNALAGGDIAAAAQTVMKPNVPKINGVNHTTSKHSSRRQGYHPHG